MSMPSDQPRRHQFWNPELGFFAHSAAGFDLAHWEPLERHLECVSARTAELASAFDAAEWGALAGLWHDLGKYLEAFQRRLFGDQLQVEHAGAGAAKSCRQATINDRGLVLAFVIAGHHAGLANLCAQQLSSLSALQARLEQNHPRLASLEHVVPPAIWNRSIPSYPRWFFPNGARRPADESKWRLAFFTRMLFSALVDADSLETEKFYEGDQKRGADRYQTITELQAKLDQALAERFAGKQAEPAVSPVNFVRAAVLDQCRAKAATPPGCFSLTVPTGGGKTLSSLAFALRHAVQHSLRRVIMVIPYTSIIEQTAAVYREVLGDANVIEHHSNLDDFADIENNDPAAIRHRLACENWDAPVIVTTNVQFFESLFASKKSRCRKLHNIAQSVIVLDEAQALPVGFLQPVLNALRELTANYRASVVLCTATQPALDWRENFTHGIAGVTEIMEDPVGLGNQLRRVRVHWPADPEVATPYAEIADRLIEHPAVLAIVHRRDDAAELTRLVAARAPDDRLFHLSALMCPAHRRQVLRRIHRALRKYRRVGRACRVVATQLVEAGVDLDFPVVFRALAGLDSVAQAAGRCNREGRLDLGHVHVFRAVSKPPGKTLESALEITRNMLELNQGQLDIADPAIFRDFFQRFYAHQELDVRNICTDVLGFNFATVAQNFRLIEDGYQQPIVIPWTNEGRQRIKQLRKIDRQPVAGGQRRELLRSLQPYTVQVQPRQFQLLRERGAVEVVLDDEDAIWVLNRQLYPRAYDKRVGLMVDEDEGLQADALIL